jgi:Uma2 family endonuclease
MLTNPPKTIMEVYKMLPEGTLAELINGRIYMTPPPNTEHQDIAMTISGEIYIALKKKKILGRVFASPIGVFLDEEENAVQPDVVFVTAKNKSMIKTDAIHGVPDFMLEILSPGNRAHDLRRKKTLYERFGVKEYWVIDPHLREATGYKIIRGSYEEFFRGVGKIQSQVLKTTIKF